METDGQRPHEKLGIHATVCWTENKRLTIDEISLKVRFENALGFWRENQQNLNGTDPRNSMANLIRRKFPLLFSFCEILSALWNRGENLGTQKYVINTELLET